ncbi:HDOD domain-containing protein [bacterium]|nr:HDOD domain-containing protein [bacterium]
MTCLKSEKKRILFVDDEPRVLGGLSRMLRPLRDEWDMAFLPSGADALELLSRERFDVIVSDMRMPGMDGAQLLSEVMRRHPHMVRIVLSGHSEKEMVLRSVGPTHQYLAKPCDADLLKATVSRACALRAILDNAQLKELVSRLDALPSLPQLYLEIVEEMRSPMASIQRVGRIIAQDLGMTAKVLQLVNSAFFGVRKQVRDPVQAASLLGMETLKALVLSLHVFSSSRDALPAGFSLESLWQHSTAVGQLARGIAIAERADKKVVEDSLLAGLLHDVGLLVLTTQLPDQYQHVLELGRGEGCSLWAAERRIFGAGHPEVGAYLLGLWGLPDPVVEALAFHHTPSECLDSRFSPLLAVHVADAWSDHANLSQNGLEGSVLDLHYLRRLGLENRLPVWKAALERTPEEAKAR